MMRISKIISVLVAVLFFAATAHSQILVSSDGPSTAGPFPNETLVENWEVVMGSNPPGMYVQRATIAHTGNNGYEFHIMQADPYGSYNTGNSDLHVEVNNVADIGGVEYAGNFEMGTGTDYWISWWVYIPSSYQYPTGSGYWIAHGQLHNSSDACDDDSYPPPIAGFIQEDGTYLMAIQGTAQACSTGPEDYAVFSSQPFNKGAWNLIVWNFQLDYDGSQYFNAWLNGNQFVTNYTGKNAYNDQVGMYYKVGQYGISNQDQSLIVDDFRIGINSDYNEMTGGSNPNPDTVSQPPDNFYPTATQPAGTTSVPFGWTTPEDETCHWGLTDVPFASLPNTATGAGGQSHSDTLTGLTDGTSTDVYVACQDTVPNTPTATYHYIVTVGQSGGGGVNLLNTDVCTINISLAYTTLSNAFDGAVGDNDSDTVATWDYTSAEVTCTFPRLYTHPVMKIYGNNTGTLQSGTWSATYKQDAGDSPRTLFTSQACNDLDYFTEDLSGSMNDPISSVTFTINGTGTGLQFGELWMEANEYGGGGPVLPAGQLVIKRINGVDGATKSINGVSGAVQRK